MSSRFNSTQENLLKMESKLLSAAIAKENALQVSFHNEAKAHQKQDDIIRHDYVTQLHELDLANDKQHEQDNFNKKVNYGEFLLMQMDEKEKQKHKVTHSPVNTTAFCEAFVDPIEKNRLKLMRQKEFKDDLDECVRQKKDLKERIHLKELAEDEKRNEFLKKQETDLLEFSEKTKQRFERKEQHKTDVAMMWKSDNNHKISELSKLVDSAMEGGRSFDDDDESSIDLAEIQRRLYTRKALLEQMEERIEASYQKFEEEKREREQLLLEVQKEEERLKKLKEEEKQKQVEYNKSLQAMIQENAEKKELEKEAMIEEDKKLMEMQKSADERINHVKIELLEKAYDDLKEYLPPRAIKEEEKMSLHSRFY